MNRTQKLNQQWRNNNLNNSTIVFFLALAILLLYPFADILPLIFGISTPTVAFVVLSIVWGIDVYRNKAIISLTRTHILIILLISWAISSVFWSLHLSQSISRVLGLIRIGVITIIFYNICSERSRIFQIICAYLVSNYIFIMIVMKNAILNAEWTTGRYSAFGLNPNLVATYIAIGLPLAIWISTYYTRNKSNKRTYLSWIGYVYIPLGIIAILLTGSRAAIVSQIPIIGYLYYMIHYNYKNMFELYMYATVLMLVFISGILTDWSVIPRIVSIWNEIITLDIGNRFEIWVVGYQLYNTRPILGIGWGAFEVAIKPYLGYEVPPESSIIGITYQLGIIGLILFISIFLSAMKTLRSNKIWVLFIIVILLLISVNDWFHMTSIWILISVIMAERAIST